VPSGEKPGRYRIRCRAVRSLWSSLPWNSREIRALFAYFDADRAKIICSSDCVAERLRFEPSVRFCHAKPRHIRKLQIAKPYQRISPYNPTSEPFNQSGSIRRPFDLKGERQAILWTKLVTLPSPRQPDWVRCDCVPSGQSQDRKFLRWKESLEAPISDNFRRLCSRFLGPLWLHFPQADSGE
jgi:hypothetical protein